MKSFFFSVGNCCLEQSPLKYFHGILASWEIYALIWSLPSVCWRGTPACHDRIKGQIHTQCRLCIHMNKHVGLWTELTLLRGKGFPEDITLLTAKVMFLLQKTLLYKTQHISSYTCSIIQPNITIIKKHCTSF